MICACSYQIASRAVLATNDSRFPALCPIAFAFFRYSPNTEVALKIGRAVPCLGSRFGRVRLTVSRIEPKKTGPVLGPVFRCLQVMLVRFHLARNSRRRM